MQTPRMLSTVRKAAPVLTDAGVGVGVAVGLLATSWTGAGPPWIVSPRPLDPVAVGLIGVVAGALALRRRYPISVLVVLNAVALAWSAAQYPGRLITASRLRAYWATQRPVGWAVTPARCTRRLLSSMTTAHTRAAARSCQR
jgi:hypothetical protein